MAVKKETVSIPSTPVAEQTHPSTGVSTPETHPSTGVFSLETHPSTGVFPIEIMPNELKTLIGNFNKRSSKKELHTLIQKLCNWKPLTAQELIDLLKRKDKKHFVRSHLTPMVKEGKLKYLFPEDEDSPNQAYVYKSNHQI